MFAFRRDLFSLGSRSFDLQTLSSFTHIGQHSRTLVSIRAHWSACLTQVHQKHTSLHPCGTHAIPTCNCALSRSSSFPESSRQSFREQLDSVGAAAPDSTAGCQAEGRSPRPENLISCEYRFTSSAQSPSCSPSLALFSSSDTSVSSDGSSDAISSHRSLRTLGRSSLRTLGSSPRPEGVDKL